jgi:hypothetical protein
MLDALLALLPSEPVTAARLLDELAGPGPRQREAVAGLLGYLIRLGVLQACVEPRHTLTGWAAQSDTPAIMIGPGGFIDVYRQPVAGLDRGYAERLTGLIELALRAGALADAGEPAPAVTLPPAITDHPRPLLDIFAECVDHGIRVRRGRAHHHDWPVARDPRSEYAGLHRWLSTQMDDAVSIDLDAATLDRFGAPPADLHWPADALVEPINSADNALVCLADVVPAGRLDARFLPALDSLGAQAGPQVAYRTFLDALGGATEILIPPLSELAANTIRRPAYTPLWTGDPDRACYITGGAATYLPLPAITLRRAGSQVIAEAEGEPIRPVLHTMRVAPLPWDTLAELLMLASPQPGHAHWRALRYTLPGWPQRTFVPRITVGGALVLSLAQWRVSRAEFWHRDDRLPAKAAALARLARVRGLPRLVNVATSPHDEPIAADLASLNSIRLFDRILQRGATALLLREFPAGRPVRDEASGGASVAELLLRLPVASTPGPAARTAAGHLLTLHGQPAGSAASSGHHPRGRKE